MVEKSILIILGSMGRGGAERVISIVSDYFCRRGWKVYIALLLFNNVDYELNKNVTVIDLSGKVQSRYKRLPEWVFGIRRLVKKIKPDRVLSFAARINIIVQIACLGLKQKIIVSERNDPYMDGRSGWIDLGTRLLYPKADAVIFQTKRAESYFSRYKLRNTYIVPNPISVSCYSGKIKPGKIVTVGNLKKQKNQAMLIQAFAGIQNHCQGTELHFYGDGSLKSELEQLAFENGISNKVFFHGNVRDVHQQIADAHIFVLSSSYEGLSNALLEAMMMGLACISTECAGADEYIRNGDNGILVPVGDVGALTTSMITLLKDVQYSRKLGEVAHHDSIEFSSENVLQKWYEIITGNEETD